MFAHDLEFELTYLNKCLANGPKWFNYVSKRLQSLQNRVNALYRFANKKDGRVKDYILNKLEPIQNEIDSMLFVIESY